MYVYYKKQQKSRRIAGFASLAIVFAAACGTSFFALSSAPDLFVKNNHETTGSEALTDDYSAAALATPLGDNDDNQDSGSDTAEELKARALEEARSAQRNQLQAQASGSQVGVVPIEVPGEVTPHPGVNPFEGQPLWLRTNTQAALLAQQWESEGHDATELALMKKIASQPAGNWFLQHSGTTFMRSVIQGAHNAGEIPQVVLYAIPYLDCYSGAGFSSHSSYKAWIDQVAGVIGSYRAMVIIEPDALAGLDCLPDDERERRLDSLSYATTKLSALANTAVYMDAGHSNWVPKAEMANRLKAIGVGQANGFSLNVSNFYGHDHLYNFATQLSDLLGGTHFVFDTSRNGLGPTNDFEWCNPPGRAIGRKPTTSTGYDRLDAYLWIKLPGESDGTCNGGPTAGTLWVEYALGLAQRSPW